MWGGNFPQNNSRPPDKKSYTSATDPRNKDILKSYLEDVATAKKTRNKIEICFLRAKKD